MRLRRPHSSSTSASDGRTADKLKVSAFHRLKMELAKQTKYLEDDKPSALWLLFVLFFFHIYICNGLKRNTKRLVR